MKHRFLVLGLISSLAMATAQAADWSDTSLGYRHGSHFAEPYNPNAIEKNIFNFSHASGYKYGSNFFNIDLLLSDDKDPFSAKATNGAGPGRKN